MRNGTQTGAQMPDYSKQQEMEAYDELPLALREVIQEAPFSVSAADMASNRAVMRAIDRKGDEAAAWLAEQLKLAYKTKISASS